MWWVSTRTSIIHEALVPDWCQSFSLFFTAATGTCPWPGDRMGIGLERKKRTSQSLRPEPVWLDWQEWRWWRAVMKRAWRKSPWRGQIKKSLCEWERKRACVCGNKLKQGEMDGWMDGSKERPSVTRQTPRDNTDWWWHWVAAVYDTVTIMMRDSFLISQASSSPSPSLFLVSPPAESWCFDPHPLRVSSSGQGQKLHWHAISHNPSNSTHVEVRKKSYFLS